MEKIKINEEEVYVRYYMVISTEGKKIKEKGVRTCLDGCGIETLPWIAKEGLTLKAVVK